MSEQFNPDVLQWVIRGLIASDLLTDEKRAVLKDFNNSRVILSEVADVLTAAPDLTLEDAWARNDEYGQRIVRSADMREGLRAFAEKRRPNWTGR